MQNDQDYLAPFGMTLNIFNKQRRKLVHFTQVILCIIRVWEYWTHMIQMLLI